MIAVGASQIGWKVPAWTASRAWVVVAALAIAPLVFAAPEVAPTPVGAPPPAGAFVLFNGRDLTGWSVFLKEPSVDPKSIWSVGDGVLRLVGKPNGYVKSDQTFADYHLHVEWRWPANASPKSNSGVFVHLHGTDAIWPPSIECQLAAGNAGQLVGGDVTLPGAPIINKKPRAPKFAATSEKPFGEWNVYDIVCRGDTIDVTVNGVHQNHVAQISVTAGRIGLQMEGYPIEFRNLWLQKL